MNEKTDYRFGIKVSTYIDGGWSFGSCISHSFGETYLFINFLFWSISIGWLMKEGDGAE